MAENHSEDPISSSVSDTISLTFLFSIGVSRLVSSIENIGQIEILMIIIMISWQFIKYLSATGFNSDSRSYVVLFVN